MHKEGESNFNNMTMLALCSTILLMCIWTGTHGGRCQCVERKNLIFDTLLPQSVCMLMIFLLN
jgi:hypothetical protein